MATIDGNNTDETLLGSSENDVINGFDGADTIYSFGGENLVYGGNGNDSVYGGDANDTLYGGLGDDSLVGTNGIDTIYGGAGHDVIRLGELFYGAAGFVDAGTGNDAVTVVETSTAVLEGGLGIDGLNIFWSQLGAADVVTINFATQTAVSANGANLTFSGFERLYAYLGAANDIVTGSGRDDSLWVNKGANRVNAGGGNDFVRYDLGDANTLAGGAGDDTLAVIANTSPVYFIVDTYDGSVDDGQLSRITGFEHYQVSGSAQNDIISTGTGNDVIFASYGDDSVYGLDGADSIEGDRGADLIEGGDGSDTLRGGRDTDTLYGGEGNDLIFAQSGDDTLYGEAGDDRLVAGLNNNTLFGDAGNDHLVMSGGSDGGFGDVGNDRLVFLEGGHSGWGGEGSDVFLFRAVDDLAEILGDFTTGVDRLRFDVDALDGAGGAVRLSFDSVSGSDPQFLFQYIAEQGHLFWDADGTGAQEAILLAITLNGESIAASDLGFIL